MTSRKLQKRNLPGALFSLLFLALIPLQLPFNLNNMTTIVKLMPFEIVVESGSVLPTPPFTVNVTVADVEDLFAWQMKLYFNSKVLNTSRDMVWYPPNHVFAGKKFVNIEPAVSEDGKGAYVLFGASLLGGESTFNGSGTLFQMSFIGIETGTSTLRLSSLAEEDTFLYDSHIHQIPFTVVDGKKASVITISLTPEDVAVRWFINISGVIFPTVSGASVIIYDKPRGNNTWFTLATVTTDLRGHYSFSWRTNQIGTFEIKAAWLGDESFRPAISETRIASVKAELPTAFIVAIILAVAIASIFVFWLKSKNKV